MKKLKFQLLVGIASVAAIAGLALSTEHKLTTLKSQKDIRTVNRNEAPAGEATKARAIVAAQPLAFEVNQGQVDQSVKFLARARGYTALFTANESQVRIKGETLLRMKLKNGSASPAIQGQELQVGKSNYLLGNDRSKWITNIPHYAKVRYRDVYPGIDAVYSGNERQLEYDFVVQPGVDPAQIRMSFDGTSKIGLNRAGDLELQTKAGVISVHKPVVYQSVNGRREPVTGDFALLASNEVGFKVGKYDSGKALVIDPVVQALAFVGGAAADDGFAVAANVVGTNITQVAITGRTQSLNADTTPASFPAGSFPVLSAFQVQHSTGTNYDAYVTKLSVDPATGVSTLLYSTFLGTAGDEAGTGIALDSTGNAFVGGYTNNPGLLAGSPVAFSGIYDAFIVKLAPTGASIPASTYLGGTGTTVAFALAMAPNGNIGIGGLTTNLTPAPTGVQTSLNATVGATDGFVATYDSNLAFVKSSYLGGSNTDQVNGVAFGPDGSLFATGFTLSGNGAAPSGFPTNSPIAVGAVPSGQQTAFVTKFNAALSSRSYSSIFGPGGEVGNGVAVDPTGAAYVVGSTKSPGLNLGLLPGALSAVPVPGTSAAAVTAGQTQGFLLSLTAAGAPAYLTLQPATANDPANSCLNLVKNGGAFPSAVACTGFFGSWNAVAVDSDQQAYVVGQVGVGGPPPTGYFADWHRFDRAGTEQPAALFVVPNTQNYGISVVNSEREEFAVGTTSGGFGVPGFLAPNPAPPPATVTAPGSTAFNGGATDALLVARHFTDIFVIPSTVTLGPVGVNSATGSTGATQTVQIVNSLGQPNTCPLTVTLSGPDAAKFNVVSIASTNTYRIEFSGTGTSSPGTFTATAVFTPTGGGACTVENVTTLSINATVVGPLNLAPDKPLTITSQVGSGVLIPINAPPNPNTITVAVTTAAGSVPYTVTQVASSRSPNWPTGCTLVTLGAPSGPATPPPGSTFTISVSTGCAAALIVGDYTETIRVAPTVSGVAASQDLQFKLSIVSGGVIQQFLPNFIFGTSTTPQTAAFTVSAPGSSPLNYSVAFAPPFDSSTPLPPANASILSGGTGSLPAGGSAVVSVQVTPAGLAPGVYGFCYAVTSPAIPTSFTCARVHVGTGIAFVNPAGGTLNISVPAGFTAANLSQPAPIYLTGLENGSVSPYSVNLPSAATVTSSFTPALPAGAVTLIAGGPGGGIQNATNASGNPCLTFALGSPTNPFGGQTCRYNITIDSTALAAGTTYVGNIQFTTGSGGPTTTLKVNLAVTQFPQLQWVNQNSSPLTGITLTGVAGSTVTSCSSQFPNPGIPGITATGGIVPNVTVTSTETTSPTISWLGTGGASGVPGSLGTVAGSAPVNIGAVQAPNFYSTNGSNIVPTVGTGALRICATAASLTTPGTYTGSVTVSGSGVGSTATLPVTFLVGPGTTTAKSKVGVFRSSFFWILDANGNGIFDGTGVGLDSTAAFGGGSVIAGDVPIYGDWSGGGTTKIGVYRSSTGHFLLDFNDNGTFDGNLADRDFPFFNAAPVAGDVPVVGDWTGTGTSKIGIYRPSTGTWFLDTNGNGIFDAGDVTTQFGGITASASCPGGDVPVTGDWTGSGTTKIGLFRCGFFWIQDTNGHGVFDSATDVTFAYGGGTIVPGDVPVVGDWNGDGKSKVGIWRANFLFVLDVDGDHVFTATDATTGGVIAWGGDGVIIGDVPVIGKWKTP
jgi:Beta-propeller repeat